MTEFSIYSFVRPIIPYNDVRLEHIRCLCAVPLKKEKKCVPLCMNGGGLGQECGEVESYDVQRSWIVCSACPVSRTVYSSDLRRRSNEVMLFCDLHVLSSLQFILCTYGGDDISGACGSTSEEADGELDCR